MEDTPSSEATLPNDNDFLTADTRLYNMAHAIFTTRQMLHSTWLNSAQLQQRIANTQDANAELLRSYNALYQTHRKALVELQDLEDKHRVLSNSFDKAFELVQQYETILMGNLDSQSEEGLNVDSRVSLLNGRLRTVEREKAELEKSYQDALVAAADRISSLNQRLDEVDSTPTVTTEDGLDLLLEGSRRRRRPKNRGGRNRRRRQSENAE